MIDSLNTAAINSCHNNVKRCLVSVCAVAILLFLPFSKAEAYVIHLQGKQIPSLVGKAIGDVGFFAFKDGRLKPVAFQWLPWSQENTPWLSKDSESHPVGQQGVVHPRTRLLLRFQDGGKRYAPQPSDIIKPSAELAVTWQGKQHYFYVVKNPYLNNPDQYVRFDRKSNQIKTTNYALMMNPKNMLDWRDFYYKGYQSPDSSQRSILDTMKIRLSAGVFTSGSRITLTNDNLSPDIKQIIPGPIASLIYADTSLKVSGITVLTIRNYFVVTPNQTEIYGFFTLPSAAHLILKTPAMSVSLDGNALLGSRLITSWTGQKMAHTDGHLSSVEKQMLKPDMPRNGWLLFQTGRHFNLLAQLQFSKDISVPVSLVYQDSTTLENKPENFPGQQPNVGFSMTDLPFGKLFSFKVRLLYSGKTIDDGGQYAHSMLSKPQVKYRTLQ